MIKMLYIFCIISPYAYAYNIPGIASNKYLKPSIRMNTPPEYDIYDVLTKLVKTSKNLDKWNLLDFINQAKDHNIDGVTLLKQEDKINGLVVIDNLYDIKPELLNIHYLETGISNLNDKVLEVLLNNDIYYTINTLPSQGMFSSERLGSLLFNGILIYICLSILSIVLDSVVPGGFTKKMLNGRMPKVGFKNPLNAGQLQSNVLIDKDEINTTFADVAGCDEAKLELEEIVSFLKNPEKYNTAGAKVPKGILLEGPPGTGKTLMARAVAGEADVSFLQISASEFVQMFVGVGASRVRELFNLGKENTPCVIFIDEIDAIGRKRGESKGNGGGNEEREQTLNQILTNMDGFDKTDSIIVMAATNRVDILDEALVRSGRFDRKVSIPLPDRDGRRKILDIHLRNKCIANNTDLDEVAEITSGFSGADIENMANEAVIMALRDNNTVINTTYLVDAYEKIAIGIPQTSRKYNVIEQQTVAYHEAGHAITALLFREFFQVRKVTIVSNSNGAGGYTLYTPSDNYKNYPTKKFLLAQLIVLLGGRAAEILLHSKLIGYYNPKTYNTDVVFNNITDLDISTGASSDLKQADNLARTYIELFGIDNNGESITIQTPSNQNPYLVLSDETKKNIDNSVSTLIKFALNKAIEIINSNIYEFSTIAEDLIIHKSISSDYLNNVNITYFF